MPLYEYRCECGEVVEALVRGGREPQDALDVGHYCDTSGKLVKLISKANVGSSGSVGYRSDTGAVAPAAESGCGHCGSPVAGSCQYDS